MSTPCTVIIGARELLDALRESAGADGEVLTLQRHERAEGARSDHDAPAQRRSSLERLFAATSRGAALINRIKADPALRRPRFASSRRRHVPRLSAPSVRAPQRTAAARRRQRCRSSATPRTAARPAAAAAESRLSRNAPRAALPDGRRAPKRRSTARSPTIVDLSTHWRADSSAPTPLRPQQRVRMILADDVGVVKFNAAVAWASFEIPKGVPRYRAGIEFTRRRSRRAVERSANANHRAAYPTPNHSAAADFSRMIVSLRPEPVDTIDTGTPRHLFEKRDVALRLARQIFVARHARARAAPARQRFVHRLALREHVQIGRPLA